MPDNKETKKKRRGSSARIDLILVITVTALVFIGSLLLDILAVVEIPRFPDASIHPVQLIPAFSVLVLGLAWYSLRRMHDLTAQTFTREEIEAELLEKERRLQSILDAVPDFVYEHALDGTLLFINQSTRRVLGWRQEHLGKIRVQDLMDEESREKAATIFEEIARTRRMKALNERPVFKLRKYLGDLVTVEANGVLLTHGLGEKPTVLTVARDITERMAVEAELQATQHQQKALLDGIPDMAWLKDLKSRFIAVNRPFAEASGYSMKFLQGKTDLDIWPRNLAESYILDDEEVIMTGHPKRSEDPMIKADGSHAWIETIRVPIMDADGRVIGTSGVGRDITERKFAEQELIRYQDQLRQLASELTLAEERERRSIAVELHDQIGQMLAVSKIRMGNLHKQLKESEHEEQAQEILEMIDQIITDVRTLTFELSSLVLYQGGLGAAIRELCNKTLAPYGIDFNTDDSEYAKVISQDAQIILYQVTRELLHNVLKHARASKVTIKLASSDKAITLSVKDNGVGVDPKIIQKHLRGRGNLGLFSIKERIGLLGGDFNIESEPGQGMLAMAVIPIR